MQEPPDPRSGSPAVGRLRDFVERSRGLRGLSGLEAATVEAVAALQRAGLAPLLLKGPALARTLYTEHEYRTFSDVDLMVAPAAIAAAREVLAALGYANTSDRQGIVDVAGVVHAETWFRPAGDLTAEVDLHTRLAGAEAEAEAVWAALGRRRATAEVAGVPVPVLDAAGLAMHVATHAAQHGPGNPKAMEDLGRALERWPEEVWDGARALAVEVQAVPAFAAGLRLAPAGERMAERLELPAAGSLDWAIHHRDARPRGTFHVRALEEADGLSGRAIVIRRALLPTRDWITSQEPAAARSRTRLVLAYGRHLLRSPAWAARAWWFNRRARRAGR